MRVDVAERAIVFRYPHEIGEVMHPPLNRLSEPVQVAATHPNRIELAARPETIDVIRQWITDGAQP